MAATINNFISAINHPSNYMRTLHSFSVVHSGLYGGVVARSYHFAQVVVEWNSKRYILAMPLSDDAQRLAQRAALVLRKSASAMLKEYRILLSEMSYVNSQGEQCYLDLVLCEIAEGKPLSLCDGEFTPAEISSKILEVRNELFRLHLKHANLTSDNIIIDSEGNLYPIALHYITLDSDNPRARVERVDRSGRGHRGAMFGFQSVGYPFEGMCVAQSEAGYGYISESGEELIAPQYLWAGDMREGRAEVETASGMGLIDCEGRYIIEPHYQIVEYDVTSGCSRAKSGGEWFVFDYQGRLIEEKPQETEAMATMAW